MNNIQRNRTFLTEFIIVILFFSIASVIIVNLYVKANDKSEASYNLTKASILCENLATELNNISYDYDNPIISTLGDASPEQVLLENGFEKIGRGKYTSNYDEKFELVYSESAFLVTLTTSVDDSYEHSKIVSYHILVSEIDGRSVVYELDTTKIVLEGDGYEE
ncbi:MAG: hypothetical protein GX225_03945 [Clostridiales bacterium]|nr:hypothetical protein [Clostridiales bacterium]